VADRHSTRRDSTWSTKPWTFEAALVKSEQAHQQGVDAGDYDELQKAMAKPDAEVSDAVTP
jgi:hypothetical protein